MPIPVTCECGARYTLKDEMAGLSLRCRKCQGVIKVPSAGIQEGMAAAPMTQPAPPRAGPPALPGDAVRPGGPPPLPSRRDDFDDEEDDRDDYGRGRRPSRHDFGERDDDEDLDPAFQRDKYLLRQKHFSINQKYYIQDEDGRNILFVERPTFVAQGCLAAFVGVMGMLATAGIFVGIGIGIHAAAGGGREPIIPVIMGVFGFLVGLVVMMILIFWLYPKRHIQFYADDSKREMLLEVLQDKKFAPINMTYTAIDPDGKVLARFRKNILYNIFRKRWYIYFPNGDVMALAMEDSLILSLLRRFIGPLFGILRTNFIITKEDGERLLGEFNRKFTLLDRYVLDMTRDRGVYMDRRIAVALGVLLDTGEMR